MKIGLSTIMIPHYVQFSAIIRYFIEFPTMYDLPSEHYRQENRQKEPQDGRLVLLPHYASFQNLNERFRDNSSPRSYFFVLIFLHTLWGSAKLLNYMLQFVMMIPRVKSRTKVTKATFQSRLNALNAECMNYFHQVMSNQVNHVTLVA